MLIDLTQMFGSTIADYIYGLETANAGAGVAWFKKLFPKEYYEYNAGTLKSVEGLASHDTVGFNQWDEEWEVGDISGINGKKGSGDYLISKNFIPVIPSTNYCISSPNEQGTSARRWVVYFYDADKYFIDYVGTLASLIQVFSVPSNCHYIKFRNNKTSTAYNHDICISLSSERNGEYESYVKHTYPIDSTLTLRGIPQLDAQNNLYYDGDEYLPDGTVTRKYGVVDLGTLSWSVLKDSRIDTGQAFQASIAYAAVGFGGISSMYPVYKNTGLTYLISIFGTSIDKTAWTLNRTIYIINSSYSDVASFKAAMSGVMLVYELATPTIETAEPYISPQIVDRYGTEEYITDSIVPVGHETKYTSNISSIRCSLYASGGTTTLLD